MVTAVVLLILFVALLVSVAWFVGVYNGLVTLRNRFKNAFAQIDVQLKRRYDLIPNLVETTKAYLGHERQTLEAVIQARGRAVSAEQRAAANPADANALRGLAEAESGLTQALGRLMVLIEAYPDLKANETIATLMEELTSTENRIAFARQGFNDAVMSYNTEREQFPGALIAGPMGFRPAELLESTTAPEQREAPKVSFG